MLAVEQGFRRSHKIGQARRARRVQRLDAFEARLHRGVAGNKVLAPIDEAVGGDRGGDRRHRADPRRKDLRPGAERAEGDRGKARGERDPPQVVRERFVLGSPLPVVPDLLLDPVGPVPVLRQRDNGLAPVALGRDRVVGGNETLLDRLLGEIIDPLLEGLGGFGLGASVCAGFRCVTEAFGLDAFRRCPRLNPPGLFA